MTWLPCVSIHISHSYNILYPEKTKNIFGEEKKLPLSLCLSFSNFVSVIFGVILTHGKQIPKSYISEEIRIMPVIESFILGTPFLSLCQEKGRLSIQTIFLCNQIDRL